MMHVYGVSSKRMVLGVDDDRKLQNKTPLQVIYQGVLSLWKTQLRKYCQRNNAT